MTQADRQRARLRALEKLVERREALSERGARIRQGVLAMSMAVQERDGAVAVAERRMCDALRQLADDAVSSREVAALCGLAVSEINRLRKLNPTAAAGSGSCAAAASSSDGKIEEPLTSTFITQREATPASA